MKRRPQPVKDGRAYRQLWRVVDGAIADCFATHPDYLAPGRERAARLSLNKRIVGSVIGFAEQSAGGRSGRGPAADTGEGADAPRPYAGRVCARLRDTCRATGAWWGRVRPSPISDPGRG